MNKTVRRAARAIAPAGARRQIRLIRAKRRIVASYGGVGLSPARSLRYIAFDH